MENKLFLKLGIGIVVTFGLLIGGYYCYGPLEFKWQKSKLYSENPEDRTEALKYFMSKGEKGLEVIKEFCKNQSDMKNYKTDGNICLKIELPKNLRLTLRNKIAEIPLIPKGVDRESSWKDFIRQAGEVEVTIHNIGKNLLEINKCEIGFYVYKIISIRLEDVEKPSRWGGQTPCVQPGKKLTMDFYQGIVGIEGPGIYRITAYYPIPIPLGLGITQDGKPIVVSNTVCVFVVDE